MNIAVKLRFIDEMKKSWENISPSFAIPDKPETNNPLQHNRNVVETMVRDEVGFVADMTDSVRIDYGDQAYDIFCW